MPATSSAPFYLDGTLQHYAWGGFNYLYNFLAQVNTERRPAAEIWYGTHAKGPSRIPQNAQNLREIVEQNPVGFLGPQVAGRFDNQLPFLLKLLDVREMLSIQLHPTKMAAEVGFRREEALGKDRAAPDRNYRDDNHKPELGVALTDFYLLHGFRSDGEIEDSLLRFGNWHQHLLPIFQDKGIRGLYQHIMRLPQATINELLEPVVSLIKRAPSSDLENPLFWAARALERYSENGDRDRGVFSIFLFNLVHLRPGEGIFQDAGIPHAYLRGTCIELMANSDNVLRGGLTPKHIDVPELLKHVNTESVTPNILYPQISGIQDGWDDYLTPTADFHLQTLSPKSGTTIVVEAGQGPSILLLTEGKLTEHRYGLQLDRHHRAIFVPDDVVLELEVNMNSVVYRAKVGQAGLQDLAAGLGHHVSDN